MKLIRLPLIVILVIAWIALVIWFHYWVQATAILGI